MCITKAAASFHNTHSLPSLTSRLWANGKTTSFDFNLRSFHALLHVIHGGQLMTEGQLMIMCEMVEESQHTQQKDFNADIYINSFADYQWHYGELNTQFCTFLQDGAGKQRPGLALPPSLGWCGITEVMGFEHTCNRKATWNYRYRSYREKVVSEFHCNKLTYLLAIY